MDKRFGKFEKYKCWRGARINYDRDVFMEPTSEGDEEFEELDDKNDIDVNDL